MKNGLQGCCIGFLSQDIAYSDCHLKDYDAIHAAVMKVFSQDKFETPSETHQRIVCANYGFTKAMINSGDSELKNRIIRLSSVEGESCIPPVKKSKKKKVVKVTTTGNLQLLDSKIIMDHLSCNHVRFIYHL